jgi:tetratricopeptide (TPR) repeat protein
MWKVFELDTGDTSLARSLAENETSAGNFTQAAAAWKRLTSANPGDANAWNQLGYTLCWSGDYAGALAALREYARLRPAEANPLDSQGDAHYWFGKFSDAAASYSAAAAKIPGFLNGGDFYKAAWARFEAGDKAGAEALFGKFRERREKANDQSIEIFAGDWLYRTGHPKEAVALLRDASGKEGTPAIHAGISAQLAVLDLLAGDRAAAFKDAAEIGASTVTPGELLVRFAAMPSAPVSEWEARAARFFAAPAFAGLRASALGYALILDGKKQAALPVWQEIVNQSPANDFFARAVLTRLKDQPVEHSAPPDPVNLNPFAAVLSQL